MIERYYIDTSIWIDIYEDRKGFNGEPLGEYGLRLLSYILLMNAKIVVTNILIKEMECKYAMEKIRGMMKPFEDIIEIIIADENQTKEARKISLERCVPYGDALHAVIARDTKCILITRDRHFLRLADISESHAPEDFLS